jgi:hypothetical protein
MNLWQTPIAMLVWSISHMKPSRLFGSLVLVCGALFLLPQLALAQFLPQGQLPVGSNAIGSAQQGNSVALSADGTTAIVGGPGDNGGTLFGSGVGAAWVYTFSNGMWVQQSKLIGPQAIGNSAQGYSVALSSDGTVALVGGAGDNDGAGAAWVFTLSNGVPSQPGIKLPLGTGAIGAANQGAAVALSADGKTAIVGGPQDNNSTGAAWVYTFGNRAWTQRSKLVDDNLAGDAQATSVALSADGTTAILGEADSLGVGAAWVYKLSNGALTGPPVKLAANNTIGQANQGVAVALSADGTTAIVGGDFDNDGVGAAWIYTFGNGGWTQQSKLAANNAIGQAFQGASVALSPDGKTALVGGSTDDTQVGAAWVYTLKNGAWKQQGKLFDNNAVGASQGAAVSLSKDTAIVGGPFYNSNVGGAWTYGLLAVDITAKSPIYLGQTSTLKWSTANVATCIASGSSGVSSVWSGSKPAGENNSQVVKPLAVSTYTYTLTCQSADGSNSATGTAYVTVNEVPHITYPPYCAPLCIKQFLGAGSPIMPFGQLPTIQSGVMLMTRSGTVDAVEVSHEGDRSVTTITVSPDSTVAVLGSLGNDVRIVKADVDRSTFLDRLRTGAFGAASWTKHAAGDPGARPNIVGVAFRDGTLSGLMITGHSNSTPGNTDAARH